MAHTYKHILSRHILRMETGALFDDNGRIKNGVRLNHFNVKKEVADLIEPAIRVLVRKKGSNSYEPTGMSLYDLATKEGSGSVYLEVFPVVKSFNGSRSDHESKVKGLVKSNSLLPNDPLIKNNIYSAASFFDVGLLTSYGFTQQSLLNLKAPDLLESSLKVRRFLGGQEIEPVAMVKVPSLESYQVLLSKYFEATYRLNLDADVIGLAFAPSLFNGGTMIRSAISAFFTYKYYHGFIQPIYDDFYSYFYSNEFVELKKVLNLAADAEQVTEAITCYKSYLETFPENTPWSYRSKTGCFADPMFNSGLRKRYIQDADFVINYFRKE